jgi:hypothetical protein
MYLAPDDELWDQRPGRDTPRQRPPRQVKPDQNWKAVTLFAIRARLHLLASQPTAVTQQAQQITALQNAALQMMTAAINRTPAALNDPPSPFDSSPADQLRAQWAARASERVVSQRLNGGQKKKDRPPLHQPGVGLQSPPAAKRGGAVDAGDWDAPGLPFHSSNVEPLLLHVENLIARNVPDPGRIATTTTADAVMQVNELCCAFEQHFPAVFADKTRARMRFSGDVSEQVELVYVAHFPPLKPNLGMPNFHMRRMDEGGPPVNSIFVDVCAYTFPSQQCYGNGQLADGDDDGGEAFRHAIFAQFSQALSRVIQSWNAKVCIIIGTPAKAVTPPQATAACNRVSVLGGCMFVEIIHRDSHLWCAGAPGLDAAAESDMLALLVLRRLGRAGFETGYNAFLAQALAARRMQGADAFSTAMKIAQNLRAGVPSEQWGMTQEEQRSARNLVEFSLLGHGAVGVMHESGDGSCTSCGVAMDVLWSMLCSIGGE